MDDHFSLLGRITAGVAHDLSNYLTAVDLSLALIRRRMPEQELDNELLRAQDATAAALQLTHYLLDHARGGTPAPTAVDLIAMVRRLLTMFARVIPDSVRVSVVVDGTPPPVIGLATELEQLTLNLILNACDAMPAGGDLRVTICGVGSAAVCLEIADTGPGPADLLSSEGCTRSRSSKRGRSDTGLGLGIVRRVADHHRASLHIAERPRGGTVVGVTFAVDRARAVGT